MRRFLVLALALSCLLLGLAGPPASAQDGPDPSPGTASARGQYEAVKAQLLATPELSPTRGVDGSISFTAANGLQVELGPSTTHRTSDAVAVPNASAGGCGFLTLCVYFNKTEQKYIGGASVAAITGIICAAAPPACGAAGVAAALVGKYVDSHGLCPANRPRLRVRVLPTPGDVQCV